MQPSSEKKIAIVCNLLAGSGKAVMLAEKLAKALTTKNIVHSVFTTSWPNDFIHFTDVFIVGGDGTINYFINRYPGIQLPLVIFNGGTGNDFHWLLYAKKTFEEQLQLALHAMPRPIDIGKCNERYFINGIGIGFEGEVVKELAGKQKLSGKTSFFITILKKIFTYRANYYTIECAEKHITGKKLLVDISNGRRAGGGFHIAPEALADDGLFDIVIVEPLNPIQRLRYLPVIEKGKHLELPFILFFREKKFIIESVGLLQYHLDGEYFEAQKLVIEILPGKVFFRF